jgi:long-chain fatty acid transport protein
MAVGLLLAGELRADDLHYQDFIVGDEAVGLGGAYTAIASDPSGGWYNPAGIVDVRNTSLSLSANLYGLQDNSTGESAFTNPEAAISKLSVVPSSAGFVQALGRTGWHGKRPFAVGMSLVVPSYRKFSISEEGAFNDPGLGLVHSGYTRAYTDSTLWAGLLGAMRLGARFSIGLALFVVHRSVDDSAASWVATGQVGDEFSTFRSATTELSFSNDSLVAALGIKWEWFDGFTFGAMVRSPSLPIYSSGTLRSARALADGVDPASFRPTPEEVRVESETRSWGEARVGLAYVIPDLLKVAFDVSAHLPVSYTLVQIEDPIARDALLIPSQIERGLVVNGNLGVELTIAKLVSIGLGGFTNFSSVGSIPQTVTRPYPADVHMFGGTLAVGYQGEHTLTRVGVQYSYGTGEDVHAVNDPAQLDSDTQGFVRVSMSQSYLYFFLSSTFRY